MKKSENFMIREVAGSYVLIPFGDKAVDFNGVISINETAKFLWENISGDFNCDSLTDMLCAEYSITQDVARKSADKFIIILKDVGAIE